jgi:telomerase protein component 1
MLVIIGEPGSGTSLPHRALQVTNSSFFTFYLGKTSLVSSFANSFLTSNRDKDDTFVLIHFVGAAPGSTNIRQTLSRLVRELIARFEFDDAVPEDYKDLKALFVSLIAKIGEQKSTDNVVLILDALNQLEETYQSHSLDWYETIK